jgi:hypothetical protein
MHQGVVTLDPSSVHHQAKTPLRSIGKERPIQYNSRLPLLLIKFGRRDPFAISLQRSKPKMFIMEVSREIIRNVRTAIQWLSCLINMNAGRQDGIIGVYIYPGVLAPANRPSQ